MSFKVSRLGFGGISIQNFNPAVAREILIKMQEDECYMIDSAKGYTVSESYFGEALKEIRNNFFLASKSMARNYQSMKNDILDSLVKFQTNYLDLYQVHNLNSQTELDILLSEDGAYKALLEAKEKGLIKHIGVTSHSIDFSKTLVESGLFESIMLPYNLVEEQAEVIFKRAKELKMVTIAMKPLCGGVLQDVEIALRFFNKNDCCDIVLVGMESVKQYNTNLQALKDRFTTIDQERTLTIKQELGNSFCRRCGYCLPCPAGINIPFQWLVDGYLNRYDLKEWAKQRYYSQNTRASSCVGCKQCESLCPYDLNISEKMNSIAKEFNDEL